MLHFYYILFITTRTNNGKGVFSVGGNAVNTLYYLRTAINILRSPPGILPTGYEPLY